MRDKVFKTYWNLARHWSEGIIYGEIKRLKTVEVYLSFIGSEFFNFAVPIVERPEDLDLNEIKNNLPTDSKGAVYLFEEHQRNGFEEFLFKNNYGLTSNDTWMAFNPSLNTPELLPENIAIVTKEKFGDFRCVLGDVFKDWTNNNDYLNICEKTIRGELKGKVADLNSEFYLIYKNDLPVSGAGLFYSRQEDIAYFHNDGTISAFRGKGYHRALIQFRIKRMKEMGITRGYSIVEQNSGSWRNYKKCGFEQIQVAHLLTLKV